VARTLNVYYDLEPVGRLSQDDGGQMTFQYDASWLGKLEPIARQLTTASA
jgi:HipA-like protein